jgi:hypothetical protein
MKETRAGLLKDNKGQRMRPSLRWLYCKLESIS